MHSLEHKLPKETIVNNHTEYTYRVTGQRKRGAPSEEAHLGIDGRRGRGGRGEEKGEGGSRGGADEVPPAAAAAGRRESGKGTATAVH